MRRIRGVRVLRRGRWGIAVKGRVGGVLLLGLVVGVGRGGVRGVRRGDAVVVEVEVVEMEVVVVVVEVGVVEEAVVVVDEIEGGYFVVG